MPKRKEHLPNLSQYDIRTRIDDYAKHKKCGGLIVSQPLPKMESTAKKGLHCVKCLRNVGKMGRTLIQEHTTSMVEHISGIGTMRIYFYPPPPSEENEGLEVPGPDPRMDPEMILPMDDPLPGQEYDSRNVPKPRRTVLHGRAETMTGRVTSTGPLNRGGQMAYENSMGKKRKIREKVKKATMSAAKWDRTSKAAAMGREAAKRATIAAVKGCTTGRTETPPEREIRLENAKKAKEELARDRAVWEVNQHRAARRSRARPIARPKDESLLDRVQYLEKIRFYEGN